MNKLLSSLLTKLLILNDPLLKTSNRPPLEMMASLLFFQFKTGFGYPTTSQWNKADCPTYVADDEGVLEILTAGTPRTVIKNLLVTIFRQGLENFMIIGVKRPKQK